MKKIYGLIGFGMLAFVLFFSMVSALNVNDAVMDLNTGYVMINVSTNVTEGDLRDIYFTFEGNFNVSFVPNTFNLTEMNPYQEVNVSLTSNKDDLRYRDGINSITLTVNSTEGISDTSTITIIKDFCKYGAKGGDLEIKNFDITNNGAGSDDEWEMFDELEIKIEIKNTNDDKIDDVQLEIRILDSKGNDVTNDFIEDDENIDLGRIYARDKVSGIFNLKVSSDVEKGKYKIFVKAYEEDNEKGQCIDNSDDELNEKYYYEFDVNTEEDFKIDELTFESLIGCGNTQTVYFDLYNFNLGDDEEMRVNLYNAELGIDLYSDKFDLDEGDKEEISFNIKIPEDSEEKTYKLKVYVEHDYRKSTKTFKTISKDYEEFSITVEGNCKIEAPLMDISFLNEDSIVKAGDTIQIELTLVNQENKEVKFMLTAEDYSSWASSIKISEPIVTLAGNGATIITYTLKIKDTLAEGDYSFNMVVSSEGKVLVTQPVAVTIEAKKGFPDLFDEVNWKLIGIILVNLVLLIAIVFVVRKILKRN